MKTQLITLLAVAATLALSVVVCPAREIAFAWNPQVDATAGFRVETRAPGGVWASAGATDTNEIKVQAPDTAFEFRVIAMAGAPNVRLESIPSEVLIIPEAPAQPAGLKIKVTVEVTVPLSTLVPAK